MVISLDIEVSIIAKTQTLKLILPKGTGKLYEIRNALSWGYENDTHKSAIVQCAVGALLKVVWKETAFQLHVHPQDTNRPPGLVPDISRTCDCIILQPPWIPVAQDHEVKEVRLEVIGNGTAIGTRGGVFPKGPSAIPGNPDFSLIVSDFRIDEEGPWRVAYPRTLGPMRCFNLNRMLANLQKTIGFPLPLAAQEITDRMVNPPAAPNHLSKPRGDVLPQTSLAGATPLTPQGGLHPSHPSHLLGAGHARASASTSQGPPGSERKPPIRQPTLVGFNGRKIRFPQPPCLVFLPLPFLSSDELTDCCWGQGTNWYWMDNVLALDLQFLGLCGPLLGADYRNRRHVLCRALAEHYIASDYERKLEPGELWIREGLAVVIADLAEAAWLDYGTMELRLVERAQKCMELEDDRLAISTDIEHCARKGSLVIHEVRRLGCPIMQLIANPTWAHISEMLTRANVNPTVFETMWITGVSFPVVSISYRLASRSSKLEMMIERKSKNIHQRNTHWDGAITFEVWGVKAKKKDGTTTRKEDGQEDKIEKLDIKTLKFTADGPSKIEGTLAVSGEFQYVKVTDVWVASEVLIEQTPKAWVAALKTLCNARTQVWIVKALCATRTYRILEQMLEAREIHSTIRMWIVGELYTNGQVDCLLKFASRVPDDEQTKPAFYKALQYIGEMQTSAAVKFVASRIKTADPWAIAAMVGQTHVHNQARHLCGRLIEQDISDPRGTIALACLRTLDPNTEKTKEKDGKKRPLDREREKRELEREEAGFRLAESLLEKVPARPKLSLSWRLSKRFCPENRKWQYDGDPPEDVPEGTIGYRQPRKVRKFAFLQSQRQPLRDPVAPVELEEFLWFHEGKKFKESDIFLHPMLAPAVPRLRTPQRRLDIGHAQAEHWTISAAQAIQQLLGYSHSFHFRNIQDMPETFLHIYRKKIPKPMDLTMVQKNLLERKYSSSKEFQTDVNLIWENAEKFNGEKSNITERAHMCRTFFREIYKTQFKRTYSLF